MKRLIFISLLCTCGIIYSQQFNIGAEIRPRYENRHGYKALMEENTDGSHSISQRTRLTFNYSDESMKAKVSLQNVRNWGDVSTLSSSDDKSSLHEAWAEAKLGNKLSLKLGRQEIAYDDHRIFGNVGWAQQARSHDAMLLKIKPSAKQSVHLGFALNTDASTATDELYSGVAGYKSFQYLWYHGKFNKLGVSVLLLNTGNEYEDANEDQIIDYMQTFGPRVTYRSQKIDLSGSFYYQTGKYEAVDINALYYGLNAGYKINSNFKLSAGYEFLSGKDQDDNTPEINTFSPLFGTNHKFNGWMDYFYVGYSNPTGLHDISATLGYKTGKFFIKAIPHFFSSDGKIFNPGNGEEMDKNLGTEIDLAMGYKLAKDIKVSAGFSKMFGTETLEILKGGDKDQNSAWGWVMFTFTPELFRTN